jgi:vancomycin resistance protein YoaR
MLTLDEVENDSGQALTVALDQEALREFLEPIAARIDRPAREARFTYDPRTGQLTPIIASQEGRTLDITRTLELVNSQVTSDARTIALPVLIEKPRIAMEDVASFGVVELVSKGTSTFKGSSAGRVRNIQVASSHFHGVVVGPGEVFSFNQFLGEVEDAFGYKQSYVIFGDRTVLGPGGGVCQVSTTAFRAAFFGGFPILQRWPHTYRVGWYEPPVGLDATVFAPAVDFRFQNDSPAHLLIQTEVDAQEGTLTFYFYGTKPSRTVELDGPHIESEIPHGEPIYEEDPSLPVGVTKQVDWAHDGMDVTIYRIVREGDRVISRDTFFSRYKPWQARFLVGTQEGETSEEA